MILQLISYILLSSFISVVPTKVHLDNLVFFMGQYFQLTNLLLELQCSSIECRYLSLASVKVKEAITFKCFSNHMTILGF